MTPRIARARSCGYGLWVAGNSDKRYLESLREGADAELGELGDEAHIFDLAIEVNLILLLVQVTTTKHPVSPHPGARSLFLCTIHAKKTPRTHFKLCVCDKAVKFL